MQYSAARDYGLVREKGSGPTHYGHSILTGGAVGESLLNQAFFSEKKIEIIQNALRYQVWAQTKQLISKQSSTELIIVMRSMYYQHGKNFPNDIPHQIQDLNDLVVAELVPIIITNVTQHETLTWILSHALSIHPAQVPDRYVV